MDIRAGIIAAIVLSLIGGFIIFRAGYRAWLSARKLTCYRIKRQRERGWIYTMLVALVLLSLSALLYVYGEPALFMTVSVLRHALTMQRVGEVTQDLWIPKYPFHYITALGCAVLSIALFFRFLGFLSEKLKP